MPAVPFRDDEDDDDESQGSFEDWLEGEGIAHGESRISLSRARSRDDPALGGALPNRSVSFEIGEEGEGEGEGEGGMSRKEIRTRRIMLACACCLSVGSHFGSYTLGPIKSSLKSGESGFASLVSASQLVNTLTPLLAGSLVPRFGAARLGLAATGLVLTGQLLVCYSERDGEDSVGGMILGFLVFGLGIAPLAVVQETIILFNKRKDSTTVARSVAAGLLLGKLASFAAAASSEPLQSISPRLPFLVAAILSLFSFLACVLYASLERTLPPMEITPGESEPPYSKHGGPLVSVKEISTFGDPFFLYILVCSLAGTWFTSIHLSSSLLKTIYSIPSASLVSSTILFSSVLAYPIVGWAVDRRPALLRILFISVTSLMTLTFLILTVLQDSLPLFLSILPLAVGIGPAALLLVLVVPRLVERHQMSTALGLHKSAEMAGAVIIQASSSWLLASTDSKELSALRVVKLLLSLCTLQLVIVLFWWRTISKRRQHSVYGPLNSVGDDDEVDLEGPPPIKTSQSEAETQRGTWGLMAIAGLIVSSWFVYIFNLVFK